MISGVGVFAILPSTVNTITKRGNKVTRDDEFYDILECIFDSTGGSQRFLLIEMGNIRDELVDKALTYGAQAYSIGWYVVIATSSGYGWQVLPHNTHRSNITSLLRGFGNLFDSVESHHFTRAEALKYKTLTSQS